MKRALLVTTGTAVGLVSVLSYSSQAAPALAGSPGDADGLGAPTPASSAGTAVGDATSESAAPSGKATKRPHTSKATSSGTPSAKPTKKSPSPKPTTSAKASKAPTKAPSSTPAPSSKAPTAKPTSAKPTTAKPTPAKPTPAKPKPKPTPKPAGPVDYLGPVVTTKYGPTQVSIRVSGGKLIDVWATTYPVGPSQPYSQMAIPILKAQTLAAKSANIAGATGASFTSGAWKTSLSGALAKAKL